MGIHSGVNNAQNYLVFIFNELRNINQVDDEKVDNLLINDSKKLKILNS